MKLPSPDLDKIPGQLRPHRQWLCSREDKVPLVAATLQRASVTNPNDWTTFEHACQVANAHSLHVGYVLNKDICLIDLDHTEDEQYKKIQDDIALRFNTYQEISQSGKGVHILCKGNVPTGVNRNKVEMYSTARYVILTGKTLNNLPIEDYSEEVTELYKIITKDYTSTVLEEIPPTLSDDDLKRRAANASNKEKFNRLYAGNWDGYTSQSDADLALMSMLAFYSQSNEQCRRIFRQSGLGVREKAMRDDYLDRGLEKIRGRQAAAALKVDLSLFLAKAILPPPPIYVPCPPPPPAGGDPPVPPHQQPPNGNEFNEKNESQPAGGPGNSSNSYFVAKAPRFDEAELYGPVGEIVRALLPHTEADPAALYAQLLCGLGNLIGRAPHIIADGQRHSANLYTIICGRTSKARKGTSWVNVRNVLEAVDPDWLASRVKSGVVSGEGVTEALKDESDRRLLLVESEFAQVLHVMSREGNTVSVLLRCAWDGGRLAVLRRKEPIDVEKAHVSMIGHITLPELHRLLSAVEMSNGTANRCLWVFADRSKLLPDGGQAPDLSALIDTLRVAVEVARTRNELRKDESARLLWHQIYAELSEPPPGRLGEILSRGEAQVMRIALLLALLDRSDFICTAHLQAAVAFWRYCEASATHIFADSFANPKAAKIWEALGKGPLTMTQVHELFGRNASKAEIDTALAELAPRIVIEANGKERTIRRK